jgi:hypothetical protein
MSSKDQNCFIYIHKVPHDVSKFLVKSPNNISIKEVGAKKSDF